MNKPTDEIRTDETKGCDTCCSGDRDTSLYGGQAVIEGVLMKGKNRAVVACRNSKGEIISRVLFDDPESKTVGIRRLPFVRGFFILWDSLSMGLRALSFSAEVAMPEEDACGKPSEEGEKHE